MINQLIASTNEAGFYSHWNLRLDSLSGEISTQQQNKLALQLIIENENDAVARERWNLTAHQVLEMKHIFCPLYLPYIKLAILEEHPLLWKYRYDELSCELAVEPGNYYELAGRLSWFYQQQTGGFINWNEDFYEFPNLIKGKKKISLSLNARMFDQLQPFAQDLGWRIDIITVAKEEAKGYLHRPQAKVLLFGNPDVSPNDHNLGQPLIIADSFTAQQIQ